MNRARITTPPPIIPATTEIFVLEPDDRDEALGTGDEEPDDLLADGEAGVEGDKTEVVGVPESATTGGAGGVFEATASGGGGEKI